MSRSTFHKSEKLKSRKIIAELFNSGTSVTAYPVKAIWKTLPDEPQHDLKAGFAVPKRNFRHAADRNLLKRRMREAYRLNKHNLADQCVKNQRPVRLMFIYTSAKMEKYDSIQKAMVKILTQLSRQIEK